MARQAFSEERVRNLLEHLSEFGGVFQDIEPRRWSHLRNQEDFDNVFDMSSEDIKNAEKVYSIGRDIAVFMRWALFAHDDIEQFPNLTSYLNLFEHSWVFKTDELQKNMEAAIDHTNAMKNPPWALEAMLELSSKQIELLKAIKPVLIELKDTNTYRKENGLPIIEDKSEPPTIFNAPQFTNIVNPPNPSSTGASHPLLSDPEKASLAMIFHYLPIKVWLIFFGLLGGAFLAGYKAGEHSLWKALFSENQSNQASPDFGKANQSGPKAP